MGGKRVEWVMGLTAHVDGVGEEVGSVGNEDDEAALNLGFAAYVSQFEEKAGSQTDGEADDKRAKEDEEEDADGFDDGQTCQLTRRSSFSVFLRCLEQHNRDGIVEYRLAEDDRVKFRVDFIRIEDGENGDWVGGG